jgi:hypothetical protein
MRQPRRTAGERTNEKYPQRRQAVESQEQPDDCGLNDKTEACDDEKRDQRACIEFDRIRASGEWRG